MEIGTKKRILVTSAERRQECKQYSKPMKFTAVSFVYTNRAVK